MNKTNYNNSKFVLRGWQNITSSKLHWPWEDLGGELYGKNDGVGMPGICGAWKARLSTFIPFILPKQKKKYNKL